MRLSYFGYSLEVTTTRQKFLFDLRPFLKAFVDYQNVDYKGRFQHAGEHIYLLPHRPGLFLFLKTARNELVKKFNSGSFEVEDIQQVLAADEEVGFASYVYFGEHYLGFASTIMAPKTAAFTNYINEIFQSIGLRHVVMNLHPFLSIVDRDDILQMPFLGRTSISVSRDNNIFDRVREMFGIEPEDFRDIDGIDVTLRPRRRQNIRDAALKVVESTSDDGVDKFTISAKEDAGDRLSELFLAGNGVLRDSIDLQSNTGIYEQIRERAANNPALDEKVHAHTSDESFGGGPYADISAFHDVAAWAALLDSV